jgi:hypothetical protein
VGVLANACPCAQGRPIVEEDAHGAPMLTSARPSRDGKSLQVNTLTLFFRLC